MSALPSNPDANWKYANLRALARLRFDETPAPTCDETASLLATLPESTQGSTRIVLIDGRVAAEASDTSRFVRFDTSRPHTADTGGAADRYFASLNQRHSPGTLCVTVPASQELDLELWLAANRLGHPSVRIEVGEGARLRLTERVLASRSAPSLTSNLHLLIDCGPQSRMDLTRVHTFVANHQHVETLDLTLGKAAECRLTQITSGGHSSRSSAFVTHTGGASRLHWNVAMLAQATQVHDAYVRIAHEAHEAHTVQRFRGIGAERSRLSFNGHMYVAAGTRDVRTEQSLKGLLAGGEAEIDLRPQLEIHADAVQAAHGATLGKLDADMLFYLLSRGIPASQAESLLKWAFVSDVLRHLPTPTVRRQVEERLADLLPGSAAARAEGA
ncbi:MAG: SufD family Fe-S cluster assembly protein [Nevskiaceae bacterium]